MSPMDLNGKPASTVDLAWNGSDEMRQQERRRVSRRLHDDIGPSLCSAGLMIGLLRSNWPELNRESRELLDTIQEALEAAVDSVRVLSYQSDPGIVTRCGLRKSIELITQGRPVDFTFEQGTPAWSMEQAESLCRIIGDALLAWDASERPGRVQLVLGHRAVQLRAPAGELLGEAALQSVRQIAARVNLSVEYRDSSVTELSVTPGKEP
ncbi:histidine kinase [Paludibaculum fermentans]|uniref:histidine kinase n=1 Tax=Paludibaculum fermentans TaxID=1473598 RepID=UPI003EBCAD7A